MPALVVPGVRVEARFDVLPPLPAPSGIVGVVGIVDRPPQNFGLVSVSKTAEIRDLLGPGTVTSMPEVVHALANGAIEAVIAPVRGGGPASVSLPNANSDEVVRLRTRANGAAANTLRRKCEPSGMRRTRSRARRSGSCAMDRRSSRSRTCVSSREPPTICSKRSTGNRATSSRSIRGSWTCCRKRAPTPSRMAGRISGTRGRSRDTERGAAPSGRWRGPGGPERHDRQE